MPLKTFVVVSLLLLLTDLGGAFLGKKEEVERRGWEKVPLNGLMPLELSKVYADISWNEQAHGAIWSPSPHTHNRDQFLP